MLDKEIEGSITNTSLNKLMIHLREYEWSDTWVIIINHGPNIIYFLFKSIYPATRIGFSNLKYEIEKETLDKFGYNRKIITCRHEGLLHYFQTYLGFLSQFHILG